jgi:transcriptional regulator with XRE-family HTH domain
MTKLKKLILQSGIKQKHIAKLIRIDYSLLSRYVTGDREIPDATAWKLARVLGVEVSKIK